MGKRTFGQDLDDVVHLLLEPDLQNTIGLVNDQGLQVLVHKAIGALQVIKKPSRCGNDDIDSLGQLLSLCASSEKKEKKEKKNKR